MPALPQAARDEILGEYVRRLREADSPLLDNTQAREQLLRQAESVLDDLAVGHFGGAAEPGPALGGGPRLLTADVGAARAMQGIHPTASLNAAIILFEAALPVLARQFAGDGPQALAACVALNRAIMQRVALAAVPYVALLISKLRTSNLGERQRVARELHDRAAHGVGVGLNNLELYRLYTQSDPERARSKLDAADKVLREALDTIRALSADLRQAVGERSLEEVVRAYLRDNVPVSAHAELVTAGDSKLLPPEIAEELYLILREAMRNALLHSRTTELTVRMDVQPKSAWGSVSDNGCGFDMPDALKSPSSGGLMSMAERAEFLGGVLDVSTAPGRGTTVTVIIPLPQNAP
jgi:signal transduction histidine kinase